MKKGLFGRLFLGIVLIGVLCMAGGIRLTADAATKKQGAAIREEAVGIEVGDTLTGTVTPKEKEQWYKFTSHKDGGYWYHFEYLTTDGQDYSAKASLYDEDYQELTTLGGGVADKKEDSLKLEPSATYYLCIQCHAYAGSSSFKIVTSKALDDGADTMGKADLELVSGKKYGFVLENRMDVDYFYFTAGAKTSEIKVGNSIQRGIMWYVYDEEKNKLGEGIAGLDETRSVKVDTVEGKKYYVCVTPYFANLYPDSKEISGSYTMTVESGSKPDEEIMFSVTLKKGSTLKLDALMQPSGKTASKATWQSSKKSVAKVDSKGKITAVKKGFAVITVTVGDLTEKIKVNVTD
ncbi:MAG: Ig-like domain-containing protein [Lachnospiraceae bacterium]|nr:Ig-like domain-containing protein [Lachnospiraceae bacterium]